MSEMRSQKCGNPECSTSTGIHGGLTFGSGVLDSHGYWEHPCRVCASAFDQNVPNIIKDLKKRLIDEGQNDPEEIESYVNSQEWLCFLAWPPSDFDYEENTRFFESYKKEINEEVEFMARFFPEEEAVE